MRHRPETNHADRRESTRSSSAWSCSTARSITRTTCATTRAWGVELCKRVGSPHVKLLYDIYHMQIMEGDVIATIRDSTTTCIAHYHTGGVPGRHEIDETQEIYYPAVMKAIVETGFKGHGARSLFPKRQDALASLRQGIQICDV